MKLGMSMLLGWLLAAPPLATHPMAAQEAGAPQGSAPTLTVQSQLVLVPTEVRTRGGETIYGLQAEDFAITADGVPQRVRMEDAGTPVPLSLVVLVQCSRSAWREGPKIRGLGTMVDAIVGGAPAEVAVVDFGKELELLSGLSADPARREAAFAKFEPCDDDPGVASLDAIAYANRLLDRHRASGRRAILLVSETRDHGSLAKPQAVIETLNRSNTVLDAVSFTPGREDLKEDLAKNDGATGGAVGLVLSALQALRKNVPKELAHETGGEYVNFGSQNAFDRDLNSLANRLHNGYQLSFQPHFPPGVQAGGLHTIEVRVLKYPDAIVQARGAYWGGAE